MFAPHLVVTPPSAPTSSTELKPCDPASPSSDPRSSKQASGWPASSSESCSSDLDVRRPLTPRQLQVLQLIREHQATTGLSPTLEELGQALGVNRVTAYGHVHALLQKGLLENLDPGASRGLDLTAEGRAVLDPAPDDRSRLPHLGRIAAGAPLPAIEDAEEVALADLLPLQGDCYLLQVSGDSMIDEGIQDGDHVLVRRDRPPRPGDLVVAILEDGSATLKRLLAAPDGGWILRAANPAWPDRHVRELEVRGVVAGVLRSLATC